MLGVGFEKAGFCVVRGPDLVFGGDIRAFHAPGGVFEGVIGGPPCQEFSIARRGLPTTGYGLKMIGEYVRVVQEAAPEWWVMENVAGVPDVKIEGYSWQRLDLWADEFGLKQYRLRHFQFGHKNGRFLVLPRGKRREKGTLERCCLASEGGRGGRRGWADFCELQGLPRDFDIPGVSVGAKYRAVGNGVPVPMAYAVAMAIKNGSFDGRGCICGCGRPITGKGNYANGSSCRMRVLRRRQLAGVTAPGAVTAAG